MSVRHWLWFGLQLTLLLIVSVSIWPMLPWWLAPALLPLVVVATAIAGDLEASARWAIWGGLAVDLLSPGWFGIRWLSILIVGLLARESRRPVAIRDLPWLWPVWFGLGGLLAHLPIAVLTQQLSVAGTTAIVLAIWGSLALGFGLWVSGQPRIHKFIPGQV